MNGGAPGPRQKKSYLHMFSTFFSQIFWRAAGFERSRRPVHGILAGVPSSRCASEPLRLIKKLSWLRNNKILTRSPPWETKQIQNFKRVKIRATSSCSRVGRKRTKAVGSMQTENSDLVLFICDPQSVAKPKRKFKLGSRN